MRIFQRTLYASRAASERRTFRRRILLEGVTPTFRHLAYVAELDPSNGLRRRLSVRTIQSPSNGCWIGQGDLLIGNAACAAAVGKVNQKRAPEPLGLLPAWRLPPWASTMERLIESPIPIPFAFVVKNRSNKLVRCSADIPGPLSSISTPTNRGLASNVRTASRRCASVGCVAIA
jgi:hypothetical protein